SVLCTLAIPSSGGGKPCLLPACGLQQDTTRDEPAGPQVARRREDQERVPALGVEMVLQHAPTLDLVLERLVGVPGVRLREPGQDLQVAQRRIVLIRLVAPAV